MSSVMTKSFKQTNGYFVTLATLPSSNMFKAPLVTGSGGGYTIAAPVSYATGLPASALGATVSTLVTTAAGLPANTLLKDMGKTLVSSSHTYRKVQPVVAGGPAVDGATGEFYIEVATGQSAQAAAAKVAFLPGLW